MTKYIGRRINVGFGIEATRGTAVAVQNWQPKTDLSFDEMSEVIQDESSIGVIADSRDSFVIRRAWGGDIGGNVETNSIGYLLLSLLGEVTSSEDSTGAYLHEFTGDMDNNSHQSLTIGVDDPAMSDYAYPLAMIDSMTISAEEGQQATFTATFKSKKGESASHTVSYSVDDKLLSKHSIFKVASNLAGLSWASAICLKSFEITVSKNLYDDYCLNGIEPEDFLNQPMNVEGSFTLLFEDETYRDYQLDGDKKAIRFELTDTDTTIGATSNPSMIIDLPLASLTEFSRSQGNDEIVTQTLTFKGLYSLADTSMIDVDLVNTTQDYTSA